MVWNKHKVSAEINCPIEKTFQVYHDLRNHPKWSPWICSVDWVDMEKEISLWKFKKFGGTYKWKAINEIVDPPKKIVWKSTDGNVEHGGCVIFKFLSEKKTLMEIEVKYKIPSFLSFFMNTSFVDHFVKKTLMADLHRFNTYLQNIPITFHDEDEFEEGSSQHVI